MKQIILGIDGMTCSACSNGLEKYLNKQEGIEEAVVNLVMATASITYDEKLTVDELNRFIKEAGFKSLGEVDLTKNNQTKGKNYFIFYGILAVLLMYVSMASMLKLPIFSFLSMNNNPIIYSVTLLLLTIPFIILGRDIIISGFKNLIHKMPNMDTLVSIGVITSFIYSLYGVIMVLLGQNHYVHHLYFESCVFVIYFIKLGRFIEKKSYNKTKEAIQKLVTITPKMAKIKTQDGYKEVTIDEVKKGDILVCMAGDKVAVDGEIVLGNTHVDESFITGESKPVVKNIKDKVIAGSINYDGNIEYKALKIGKNSTISEIVKLVIEATNTKAPISKIADVVSGYFVYIVLTISILNLIINFIMGTSISISLTRFVTILVVACPCALGLATPLAIVISEGLCASKGILVKSSEILEIANKIDTIVFDKTGTLTNGNLNISKIFNYSKLNERELIKILGSIEYSSNHPIAKSINKYIIDKNIDINKNYISKNIPGMGIKSEYNKNIYYACNSKMLDKLKIKNSHIDDELLLSKNGNTIIYIVKNNTILGLVGIRDTVRKESISLIKRLKKMDIDVIMLTGDNTETAKIVGNEIGIDNIKANVMPKEKTNFLKELKKQGKRVIMVGDGINDAPSLAIADIGISVSSGTDIANDSSDVILINNNLEKIIDLVNISKKTIKIIKQNLFWAFLYNFLMIPVAAGILSKWNININPMIACFSMLLSSFLVTTNSLRIKKGN